MCHYSICTNNCIITNRYIPQYTCTGTYHHMITNNGSTAVVNSSRPFTA